MNTVQPCNYADLLAKVFDADSDAMLVRWGFPRPIYSCEDCGLPLFKGNKSGLCLDCRHQRTLITVTCEECGKQFQRRAKIVIHLMGRRNQKLILCGKRCLGKRWGRLYGFGEHPHHAGKVRNETTWNLVWEKYLETGFGKVRLSRMIGVPAGSIGVILRTKKAEALDASTT